MSYRIAMLIALSINKHSSLKLFKTHFELIMHFILLKAYFFQKNLCNLLQKCHAYYIILLSFLFWCLLYQDLTIKKPPIQKEKVLFIYDSCKVMHIWVQASKWFVLRHYIILEAKFNNFLAPWFFSMQLTVLKLQFKLKILRQKLRAK